MYFAKKFNGASFYDFMLAVEKVYLNQWCGGVRKDERFGDYAKILRSIEQESQAEDVIKGLKYDPKSIFAAISSKSLYGSRYAKYFLLRLEVLSTENDVYKEMNAKSIEHVLPQNPNANSEWAKDPDFKEHQQVVNTLGNLVLLSKSKNSSASNNDFAIKKEKYLKDRMSDYPRSLRITHEDSWTIAKIRATTTELSKIILNNP